MRGKRRTTVDPNIPFYTLMRDAERKILRDALEYNGWNQSATSRTLGISHTFIGQRAKELGGVLPGEPRLEPYKPGIKSSEKPGYKRPASKVAAANRGKAADDAARKTDGVDRQEDRPSDPSPVE